MPWNPHQNWTRDSLKIVTSEELLIRYDNGERDFSGVDLILSDEAYFCYSGIELRGLTLKDIILRGAVLRDVDMRGVDLDGADLGGIFMEECNLHKAAIRRANLAGACLSRCSFNDADLSGSNLNHLNGSFSAFRGAKIPSFENAILIGSNFENATINGTICGKYTNNFVYQTIMPDGQKIEEAILY